MNRNTYTLKTLSKARTLVKAAEKLRDATASIYEGLEEGAAGKAAWVVGAYAKATDALQAAQNARDAIIRHRKELYIALSEG